MPSSDKRSTLEFLNDGKRPPPFPASHIVLDDNYVFVSGLVAADIASEDDPAMGDVIAETRLVLSEVCQMLESVCCGMDRIVRVDVHLAKLDDIEDMNTSYREFFSSERFPARTTTESPHLAGGSRVEFTVLARRS